MKFSNSAMTAVAAVLLTAPRCAANTDLDSIMANWAFGSAEPAEPTDPFAESETNVAPPPASDPFSDPQPDPYAESAPGNDLSKWGYVPSSAQPQQIVPGNNQAPPPSKTLDEVVANFLGGGGGSATPQSPAPGSIQNNAPGYNDPIPVPNFNEPGVVQPQTLDPDAVNYPKPPPPPRESPKGYNTLDDVLAKWGFGAYEPLEEPIKPQPLYPDEGTGGGYGGYGGYGDGYKKDDDIDFILNHFDYLGTDTEPGMPMAGGPKEGGKNVKDDLHEILNNFGEGTKEPYGAGGGRGHDPGGDHGYGKENGHEVLDEILDEYYAGEFDPTQHELGHQPYGVGGGHGPVGGHDYVKGGGTDPVGDILDEYYTGKLDPTQHEPGHQPHGVGGGHGPVGGHDYVKGGGTDPVGDILDEYYTGKLDPTQHEPGHQPHGVGGGHGPVGGHDYDKGGSTDPVDDILDKYYTVKYEPTHHEPSHQDIIDHVLHKYYQKGEKKQHPPVDPHYDELPPGHPPIAEHPLDPLKPHGPVCIDRSLEAKKTGLQGRECIRRNQAICRNDYAFGIKSSEVGDSETYFVEAWHLTTPLMPIFQDFSMATELCIGDSNRHEDTAYMTVRTEKEMYYLVCPGVGKSRKNPKLKISENTAEAVVKFSRGSSDKDIMWKIKPDGTDPTNPHCTWEHIPLDKGGWDEKPEDTVPPMPQWMPAKPAP